VIVPDITNPFFALLVRSVERAAREADLQVLLVDTGEQSDEEERAARTLGPEVDGLILVSPRKVHRSLDVLAATPTVFVNRPVTGRASVVMRSAEAAADALRHLVDLGHRRLAYVGGPKGSWAAGERRDAVVRTGRSLGIEVLAIPADAPTVEGASSAVDAIIEHEVTAVMAFNDQLALGLMSTLSRRGLQAPQDISIVGCDDVPLADLVAPPLTTIRMPTEEAGLAAVGLLTGEPSTVKLSGSFVERGSTGPVASPKRRAPR